MNRILFAEELGPTWKTHLCGVVDILKGRVTGHHGSQVGQGTHGIDPALCVIWFGAFKQLNHCKDRWRSGLHHLHDTSVLIKTFMRPILTDLCKHNTDYALDADQRPGKPELLLLVSMTVITSSAAKQKQPEMQAARGSFPWRGFVFKRGAFLLAPDLSHTRGQSALNYNWRRGEGQQRWRLARKTKLQR